MTTTILTLLGLMASLLTSAEQSNSPVLQAKAVALAGQAVQLASLAQNSELIARLAENTNHNIWPNATRLRNAYYPDTKGTLVLPGGEVQILDAYTSFGDLNGDAVDDAMVVLKITSLGGTSQYRLGAMVNQDGFIYYAAGYGLGELPEIHEHHIVPGGTFTFDATRRGMPRTTETYRLVGNTLVSL